MILQEEFIKHGYTDLLRVCDLSEYGFDLADLYPPEEKHEELLGLFISEARDDIFFLLDGNNMEILPLCRKWDDSIRVFTIANGRSNAVEKFKYNIVQLIVYSGEEPDKSSECNLMMSRKIIIEGDLTDRERVRIADDEAIELPFRMISADAFIPDPEKKAHLEQLIPNNESLLKLLTADLKKAKRKEGASTQKKTLDADNYNKIREWLEK